MGKKSDRHYRVVQLAMMEMLAKVSLRKKEAELIKMSILKVLSDPILELAKLVTNPIIIFQSTATHS